MFNSATFQSLLLAGACLSSWAAPLGSSVPSDGSCCGRGQQGLQEMSEKPGIIHKGEKHKATAVPPSQMQDRREVTKTPLAPINPESTKSFLLYLPSMQSDSTDDSFSLSPLTSNPATQHTSLTITSGDNSRKISQLPQSSPPLEVQHGAEGVEEVALLSRSVHGGVGPVTTAGKEVKHVGLDERGVGAYDLYHERTNETDAVITHSADKQSSPIPGSSEEPFVDHLPLSRNGTTNVVSPQWDLTTSPTVDIGRGGRRKFIAENVEADNWPSKFSGNKEKSDYIKPGSSDREDDTATLLIGTPLQGDDKRWETDTIIGTPSALLNQESTKGFLFYLPSVASDFTDDSFSLSPLTNNPTAPHTSLTITSGDSLGELEARLLTTVELKDNTPVSGLPQPDLTLSSKLVEPADTWTEPAHLQEEDVSALPTSQEVGTEATMSSEDLPLIFEPFEDVTPPGSLALASELSVAMAPTAGTVGDAELEQMVSMDTDHISSDVPLSGMLDWPSSWQTSGAEKSETVTPSKMPLDGPVTESDHLTEYYGRTQNDDITQSSVTQQTLTVSETIQLPTSKPKSGMEELESKEEPDEEEEDEEMEDSEEDEEESEEDLAETTMAPPTRPPYSLIPPPPVWVQRNQGLVRSWVELIREKAGYVSGMLAPVGIGIAGALLLVGALYSIRVIHRRRRDNFKHQRRKPPREVRNGPDNAMLLADSSEDEF